MTSVDAVEQASGLIIVTLFGREQTLALECAATFRRIGGLDKLGAGHPSVAIVQRNLASVLLDLEKNYEEAEQLARRALETLRKKQPADSWRVSDAEGVWGSCLAALGRPEEAEPLLLGGYERLSKDPTVTSIYRSGALERLVSFYDSVGRSDEAAAYLAKAESASGNASEEAAE